MISTLPLLDVFFTKKEYMYSKKIIKLLKNKYWKNGMFYDTKLKQDRAVCFHSRDIRKHDNCFNDSVINYDEFMVDLTDSMKNIKCKIISISINLYEYLKKGIHIMFIMWHLIFCWKDIFMQLIIIERE